MEGNTETMPRCAGRSIGRNVWIEFASEPGVVQGGLKAADNLTQREFLDMLNVVFRADGGFQARLTGSVVPPITATDQPLVHGQYVLTPLYQGQQMRTGDERFYHRTRSMTLSSASREDAFVDQVRHRDQRCVITGRLVPAGSIEADDWVTFQAAHIFPLALHHIFTTHGFSQLISYSHPLGINSPQNGVLLKADIHSLWDSYDISVNPDNGYRVQSFHPVANEFHGNILHEVCRQQGDHLAIIDALLRWHYEQAVLCNMRGAGEAIFEFDFPPGTDMIGKILEGPKPAEQMEAEMFNRLYHWQEAQFTSHKDAKDDEPGEQVYL
ncbi:hypothetical protein VE00_02284 [Pseudogymnoascus sp. WSF 3629]|nr:hypothetical protein VE00_02284 [Pseudogymnoascus sp. WSF 3629]